MFIPRNYAVLGGRTTLCWGGGENYAVLGGENYAVLGGENYAVLGGGRTNDAYSQPVDADDA